MTETLCPAVVLVADRTLSADYRVLFEGIFATMQTTKVPAVAMRSFVAPAQRCDSQDRALAVPLGLRRLESSLLAGTGLGSNDIVCTTPERLRRLVGPWTKAVCFSSSDPLGRGMSNTTTKSFWSGELYTARWARELLEGLSGPKRKYGFKIVAGGAGAWQYAQDANAAQQHGVDVIFEGYCEALAPGLIGDILAGRDVPGHLSESACQCGLVKPIAGPSTMGVVELSRGCGKACAFCAMAMRPMEHLDEDLILADVQANVRGGQRSIVSSSEDFFRYGSAGGKLNFDRLAGLLERMRQIDGLAFMQLDHGNVTSVAQLSDEQLAQTRRLLTWQRRTEYLWVNMGVESANGKLVAANGPGKIPPYRPEDWDELVRQTAARLTHAGYFGVYSIVLGLPGETPADVAATLALVKFLATQRAVVFPVFHEPIRPEAQARGEAFGIARMRADHLELLRTCYENNFRQVPRLYWDNQRAGGVGWFKRTLVQMLGKTEVAGWRRNFVRLGKAIGNRQ